MTSIASKAGPRPVRAPHGTELSCKGWAQEAALRMLMNNLDPDVAEDPDHLVVYGGTGRAARSWEAFDAIVPFPIVMLLVAPALALDHSLHGARHVRRHLLPQRGNHRIRRRTEHLPFIRLQLAGDHLHQRGFAHVGAANQYNGRGYAHNKLASTLTA